MNGPVREEPLPWPDPARCTPVQQPHAGCEACHSEAGTPAGATKPAGESHAPIPPPAKTNEAARPERRLSADERQSGLVVRLASVRGRLGNGAAASVRGATSEGVRKISELGE